MTDEPPAKRQEQQSEPEANRSVRRGVFAFLEQSGKQVGIEDTKADTGAEPARSTPRAVAKEQEAAGTPAGSPAMPSFKLKILVLEDYPEVMDTIVNNITRHLHARQPGEAAEGEDAGQHYTIQGVGSIEVSRATRPEEALGLFGNYDRDTRELSDLYDLDAQEIIYGVFDVVLGHNLSGIDVLEIIREHVPEFRAIVLTAQTNTEEELGRTVELADAYRKKQVSMDPEHRYLLAQDIAEKVTDIVEERRARREAIRSKALLSTMPELLAIVLDYYDFVTGAHCRGVTDLALYIGKQLKTSKRYLGRPEYDDQQLDLEMLGFNAVLHDIGKVMAPKRILGKTGMFSKEEADLVEITCRELAADVDNWGELDEEVRAGLKRRLAEFSIDEERQQEIKLLGRLAPNEVEVVRFHVPASELIRDDLRPYVEQRLAEPALVEYIMRLFDGLYHHERPDGSGYPYGYSGEEYDALPTAAKVILVADTYHALRSKRSYKPGMSHAVAVNLLRELAGENTVVSDCVDVISGLPKEIVESVDKLNERRIASLTRKAHDRVFNLGVRNPAQLFADLMSSNALNPEEYLSDSQP